MAAFGRARSPFSNSDLHARSGVGLENVYAGRGMVQPVDHGSRTVNTYDAARLRGGPEVDQEWLRQREEFTAFHNASTSDTPLSPNRPSSWTHAGEIIASDRGLSPLHDVARHRAESLERDLAARDAVRDRAFHETMANGNRDSAPRETSGNGLFKAPNLAKDIHPVERALEQVQTELHYQNRRQDDVLDRLGRTESELSRVAKLTLENEGTQATEQQERHQSLTNLTRRTEDALLTCESLKKTQDHHIQKVERLEAVRGDSGRTTEELDRLRSDVDTLQGAVRDKLDVFGQAFRRLEQTERIFDENAKLRQEVSQLRRQNERRDLEMAAVQGQIDALTKLVREQLKEPQSPGGREREER